MPISGSTTSQSATASRAAELRLAVLNLFDENYRLNPLNLHPELPRGRTLAATLRLNF